MVVGIFENPYQGFDFFQQKSDSMATMKGIGYSMDCDL
jgi:hypothetical protein